MSKIDDINSLIIESKLSGEISTKEISDGNHTFEELYRHRITLFCTLCNLLPEISWKSKKHFDEENDPMFDDSFIAGINTPEGMATYDLYSSEDVIDRILSLNKSMLSESYKKVK